MGIWILKAILGMSKGVSIIVGVTFLLIMGLASWSEISLLLEVNYGVPYSLTFGVGFGLVLIAIAFITAGWYLYDTVKQVIKFKQKGK